MIKSNHYWRTEGNLQTRLRALSTQVKAIPELEFLCFDALPKLSAQRAPILHKVPALSEDKTLFP